jgi:DNA-binding MarR family transcriptional regulator
VTVPFETTLLVRDTCLCLHVQRTARALARRFDEALKPVGLTNGQFSLLMSLNRPAGMPPAGIKGVAELLAMDRTTLTAALKVLERRELIVIRVDPQDRRGRFLALTAAGRKALAAAVPVWRRHHRALEKLLHDPGRVRAELGKLSTA